MSYKKKLKLLVGKFHINKKHLTFTLLYIIIIIIIIFVKLYILNSYTVTPYIHTYITSCITPTGVRENRAPNET